MGCAGPCATKFRVLHSNQSFIINDTLGPLSLGATLRYTDALAHTATTIISRSSPEPSMYTALFRATPCSPATCMALRLSCITASGSCRLFGSVLVRQRRVVQVDADLAVGHALVAEGVLDLGHVARRGAGEVVVA